MDQLLLVPGWSSAGHMSIALIISQDVSSRRREGTPLKCQEHQEAAGGREFVVGHIIGCTL